MLTQLSPIEIRIAGESDAQAITDLINAAFKVAENFFVDEDRIDLPTVNGLLEKGEFLLAERNKALVGCVYLEPRGERTYLGLLSVEPSAQNCGLGSLLMNASEERCRSWNSSHLDILIVNLRAELPAFYGKRGYVETGTSPFPDEVVTKVPVHFVNMSKAL